MRKVILWVCVWSLLPFPAWAKNEASLYEDLGAPSIETKISALEEIEKQGLASNRIQESLVYLALYTEDQKLKAAATSALSSLSRRYYLYKAHNKLVEAVLIDNSQNIRKDALNILSLRENWAKHATQKFQEAAVFDVNRDFRSNAAEAVTVVSGYQTQAIQRWQAIVKNSWGVYHPKTQIHAIEALSKMPADRGSTIVPTLLNALQDKGHDVRETSYIALQSFPKQASQIIPKLIENYKKPLTSIRANYWPASEKMALLSTLGKFGISEAASLEKFGAPETSLDSFFLEEFRAELERYKTGHDSYILENMLVTIENMKLKSALPEISWIALHAENPYVREKALSAYENILASRAPEEFPFEPSISALTAPSHQNTNLCQTLCKVLENIQNLSQNLNRSNIWHEPTWDAAMEGLSGLYISKVSSFCEGADTLLNDLIIRLTQSTQDQAETCANPPHTFQDLQKNVHALIDTSTHTLQVASDVYAKQFFTLLFRDILVRKPNLPFGQREKINRLRMEMERHLKRDLDRARQYPSGLVGGSLFNTYAIATSMIALPNSQIDTNNIYFLKEAIDSRNPLNIAYDPQEPKRNERASAARAVPVHLALYLNAESPESAQTQKEILKRSLRNYIQNLPSMMVHLRRDKTHLPPDALAPYYLFSTIPYATAATRMLLENATPEEKTELQSIQSELKSALMSLIQEDGTFYTPEYQASEYYVNPLFGLALIPLAEECVQPSEMPSAPAAFNFHGILD